MMCDTLDSTRSLLPAEVPFAVYNVGTRLSEFHCGREIQGHPRLNFLSPGFEFFRLNVPWALDRDLFLTIALFFQRAVERQCTGSVFVSITLCSRAHRRAIGTSLLRRQLISGSRLQ